MNKTVEKDICEICNDIQGWEKLRNKRLLITGARGYITTYLVNSFMKLNDIYNLKIKIYALCREKDKSEKYYSELIGRDDFELIIQDVCEKIDNIYHVDIVIHAASIANIYAQLKNPYDTLKANIIGLNNIIDYCEEHNCEQLLFFSSFLVYGDLNMKADENITPLGYLDFRNYKNAYALSKQMGELMLNCKKRSGFKPKVKIIRLLNVYGPGEHYNEKKAMTDFLGNFLRTEDIILKSDGHQIRSYLYLTDAIKGIFYILLNGKDKECYNLASEKNIFTIKEMAEILAHNSENITVKIIKKDERYFKNNDSVMLADTTKLKSLGWKETVLLTDGIKRLIAWAKDSDYFQ